MATPREFGRAVIARDITIETLRKQLDNLPQILEDTIGMYVEFIDLHGYEPERAKAAAVSEILEGMKAEEELRAEGEA